MVDRMFNSKNKTSAVPNIAFVIIMSQARSSRPILLHYKTTIPVRA